MNKVILAGRLGQDPTYKLLNNDNSVANFSLATTETRNVEGEKKTQTEWHNIAAWKKLANFVNNYLKKGDQVLVEGKIKYDTYEKDGIKKYKTSIVASNVKAFWGESKANNKSEEIKITEDDLPF
jgi:single-strand DNA-binding protein